MMITVNQSFTVRSQSQMARPSDSRLASPSVPHPLRSSACSLLFMWLSIQLQNTVVFIFSLEHSKLVSDTLAAVFCKVSRQAISSFPMFDLNICHQRQATRRRNKTNKHKPKHKTQNAQKQNRKTKPNKIQSTQNTPNKSQNAQKQNTKQNIIKPKESKTFPRSRLLAGLTLRASISRFMSSHSAFRSPTLVFSNDTMSLPICSRSYLLT